MKSSADYRLKIMHFISGDLWAGAETMACNLLRHLKDYDDVDISTILFNEGRLADELRASGLAVYVIDENLHSFQEIFQQICKSIKSYLPDIIHSHRYKENLLALLASRSCRGIKLISTQHGLPEYHAKIPRIIRQLKMRTNFFALSRFFITVAVSADIRNILINRFGFLNEKVEIISNGIELPPLLPDREKSGPCVIGSSGRLFPVKDYPLMIEIARAISATGAKDVRFELAGDGPELSALESLVQRYGLDTSFILKGRLDNMDTFYSGLDIYLNTSVHEGIPMTILEALSHGLPVIAPAVGGIVEIIADGKEGFLLGSRSPVDFAEKCLILKDNPVERNKMSRAARERAEQAFSAERMAGDYYRLYRRTASAAWHH